MGKECQSVSAVTYPQRLSQIGDVIPQEVITGGAICHRVTAARRGVMWKAKTYSFKYSDILGIKYLPLKRHWDHFNEIFVAVCIGSCQNCHFVNTSLCVISVGSITFRVTPMWHWILNQLMMSVPLISHPHEASNAFRHTAPYTLFNKLAYVINGKCPFFLLICGSNFCNVSAAFITRERRLGIFLVWDSCDHDMSRARR